jgi:tyrosyl-tRNA synthetase
MSLVTNPTTINTILTRGVSEILPDIDSLATLMAQRPIRVYLGIDPTGAFLTLGHSVVLRKLQQFAELGHEVILLIGNGTVRIGDPTGKDASRPVLTDQEIESNFKDWQKQASKILDFDHITLKHNGDWLDKLHFSELVQLMAKTTVQQLLERDMFQERITKGLPIHGHEIIYPLLQGYDSVAMDVDLEIGGTDQTFNMLMGRTLQKSYNNKEKWVLSTPIINGTDGRKMSKSLNNFIAITDAPNSMYGKIMSIADEQIITYLELLTDVPTATLIEITTALSAGENPMTFKKLLAKTITQQYHTDSEATAAEHFFESTVQEKNIPENIPTIVVPKEPLELLALSKLCAPEESNSALRRLIEQGALELLPSGEKPLDPQAIVPNTTETVRIGKRRYYSLIRS